MRHIDDRRWAALQRAIAKTMDEHAPGWTDHTDSDPGVALMQVLAFLAGEFSHRGALPERAIPSVERVVDALSSLTGSGTVRISVNGERWQRVPSFADAGPDASAYTLDEDAGIAFGDGRHGRRPEAGDRIVAHYPGGSGAERHTSLTLRATWPFPGRRYGVSLAAAGTLHYQAAAVSGEQWSGVKRPRYVEGRVLTAGDFRDEQTYLLSKHRQHQATLHGSGTVSGLSVAVDAGGTSVTVGAGLALDAEGREIYLNRAACVSIAEDAPSPSLVIIEYAEHSTDPVPVSIGEPEVTRIEEGARVLLGATALAGGVPIARIVRHDDGWRIDSSYRPRQVGT